MQWITQALHGIEYNEAGCVMMCDVKAATSRERRARLAVFSFCAKTRGVGTHVRAPYIWIYALAFLIFETITVHSTLYWLLAIGSRLDSPTSGKEVTAVRTTYNALLL